MKVRRMRWAGHVTQMGEKRNAYRLLVGKPEGRRPVGRPRRRWLNNIRMDLVEVGWGDVDWIGLAQDRDRWRALANSVLNLQVPWNAGKLSSVMQYGCFSEPRGRDEHEEASIRWKTLDCRYHGHHSQTG
jgi:hypothetical protein